MSLAQLFFVERWAGVVSGQNALQGRVRLLDLHHGIVDQLADGHLLGVLLQKRPAGLFGLVKPEHVVVEVKMTRKGLGQKELVTQLAEDILRYQSH